MLPRLAKLDGAINGVLIVLVFVTPRLVAGDVIETVAVDDVHNSEPFGEKAILAIYLSQVCRSSSSDPHRS
jgi:hypothetical protein